MSEKVEEKVLNEEEKVMKGKQKSVGKIIDTLLQNPSVILKQSSIIINDLKKENKKLKEDLIEANKKIQYLNGKIYAYEAFENKITKHLL